jgi:ferredoxin
VTAADVEAGVDDDPGTAVGVRIRTHPGLCNGHGVCHRFGPTVYALDEEGYVAVHLLEVPEAQAVEAWRGASVCPERAITVIGEPEAYWVERVGSRARGSDS